MSHRWNPVDSLKHDIRFAVRQLRKSPGFASTAILTLALGMAQHRDLCLCRCGPVRPLPYRARPASSVYSNGPDFSPVEPVVCRLPGLEEDEHGLHVVAAYQSSGAMLTTSDGVERVPVARVSDDFFRTLGVTPMLGRDFRSGEDLPVRSENRASELWRVADALRRPA